MEVASNGDHAGCIQEERMIIASSSRSGGSANSRIRAVHTGQDGQLGSTGIHVADDVRSRLLCRRDDVRIRCLLSAAFG